MTRTSSLGTDGCRHDRAVNQCRYGMGCLSIFRHQKESLPVILDARVVNPRPLGGTAMAPTRNPKIYPKQSRPDSETVQTSQTRPDSDTKLVTPFRATIPQIVLTSQRSQRAISFVILVAWRLHFGNLLSTLEGHGRVRYPFPHRMCDSPDPSAVGRGLTEALRQNG